MTVPRLETVLQNATVGVRRLLVRLRSDPNRPTARNITALGGRRVARATTVRVRVSAVFRPHPDGAAHRVSPPGALILHVRRALGRMHRARLDTLRIRFTPAFIRDRLLPIGVASLVLGASAFSAASGTGASGGTGDTHAGGDVPRIVVGGDNGGVGGVGQGTGDVTAPGVDAGGAGLTAKAANEADPSLVPQQGPFLNDGTLLMPVAVNTTVADGSAKLTSYKVRSGDTLTGIAHHFGVSMMSVWWANDLTSKDELHVGQTLVIPPVSGLVLTVVSGDTLDSVAARTGVTADQILAFNGLTDPNLVIGQKLIIPGAVGKGIPTPKPQPVLAAAGHGTGGGTVYHPPASSYGGGNFNWPVPGGYISQYFHYGHPAVDIAAPYGSSIEAAASGTVIFAGWKDDGGGYQVWLSHGSGLYTAYYHMSAITVGVGEQVGSGSQIGRIGTSGWATGPHCHFEVWRGYPWEGSSYRVNPLGYL